MRTKIRRLALLGVLMGGLLGTGLMAPAQAAGTTQISGSGYYDFAGTVCDAAPTGFADYAPLVLEGDLEGCLYTDVQGFKFHEAPSGVYQEVGRELIVASLNGGPVSTIETTYRFESKWDPDAATGVEVRGRCQHPLVSATGTDAFAGATGRLNFKDDVENAVFYYRGHIRIG